MSSFVNLNNPTQPPIHLCLNITEKGHMIVPDWYNKILSYTKTYGKNKFFQL